MVDSTDFLASVLSQKPKRHVGGVRQDPEPDRKLCVVRFDEGTFRVIYIHRGIYEGSTAYYDGPSMLEAISKWLPAD